MSFLRNAWYCAGWAADLGADTLTAITLLAEPVLLYRLRDGSAVAIGNRCPHRFAPLHKGVKVDDAVQCPYHGLRFDATGQCSHNPHGDGAIPRAAQVKAYPLVERDGVLWIWMGEAGAADPGLIPDFSEIARRDGWAVIQGHLNVAAHYELLTDNLMDLSHVPYLHPFLSFDGPPPEGFREVRELKQDGDTVWSMHKTLNTPMSPLFAMLWGDAPPTAEMYADMRWDAPANLLLFVGMAPEGDRGGGVPLPTAHLLTPETATRTHYFWAQARNRAVDDEAMSRQLWHGIDEVFRTQDEVMVVDCQQLMGTTDLMSLKPVLLPGDGPAVRARRVLANRLAKETAA